jgi:nicotinate-nucleotide adenylyltransferase
MKTGLFFGSFNPIHIGHLAIANYFVEYTDLKKIWFVISPQSPFKTKTSLLAEHHRYALVQTAVEDDYRFKACNIEFHLPKPSYTIDTLTYLQEKYPKQKFALIMGADNIINLHKWKNYENIIKNYEIYVYPRPGIDLSLYTNNKKIHITKAPLIEISASFIRNAIKEKKDVRYFLNSKVWEYIDEMNFYKN